MSNLRSAPLAPLDTTCGSLLYELKIIWDEVGETDTDRDKMLLELERECLEVYRRKVDQSNRSRAQLRQEIADYEAELAAICSAMGERPVHLRQSDKPAGSLKEELQKIIPQLEEMRKKKSERKSQFLEILKQIQKISEEINGSTEYNPSKIIVNESDLSSRHLEELHGKLEMLHEEKNNRLMQIHEHLKKLNSLCSVLGMDYKQTANEVNDCLTDMERPQNISNDTIRQLAAVIENLREIKLQRMQKLQDLATTMLQLWHLMDTPAEEQQVFQNVTRNVAASEDEITEPNTLSMDYINYFEAEVAKLEELKSSKMKEFVLKKRSELEEICRKTRLIPECDTEVDYLIEAIERGSLDAGCVLEQIGLQIAKVKDEAFSRKEILEKVEKWRAACEEESWLEEYNRDENRYNAGRGSHLQLKRAEKARKLINKLPAMVESLASNTIAWERERGVEFTYDGIRLLSMLEEYNILRQEKEEEQRRQRDQKKLQGQFITEQETLYGSKPSPSKAHSVRKAPRMSTGGANSRRFSVGGAMLQTPKPDLKSRPSSRKGDRVFHKDDNFSVGSKGLDVAGLLAKKHSLGSKTSHEAELPPLRKPFSPISSAVSSKASVASLSNDSSEDIRKVVQNSNLEAFTTPHKTTNILDDEKWTPKTTPIPLPSNQEAFTTPRKATNILDNENQTPKTIPNPIPSTPSTVSVPMQTAMTPAPPVPFSTTIVGDTHKDIEYSFEERRAGFVVPKAQLQV